MIYGRRYRNWHYATLVFIYLVIIAGSIVRTSGSGMGCPDWPKCFGQWVPPTSEEELPANIHEELGERRVEKATKFVRLLKTLGFEKSAERIENDPYLSQEENFNVYRTWTEYVNRLVGFIAGNLMLILFIWTMIKYRKDRKLLILTFLNLIFISFEGWLGSIVVASNLVPWTITLHLLFALIILLIQTYLVYYLADNKRFDSVSKSLKWILGISFVLTFVQMFLGTQVRESVDTLIREGMSREGWVEAIGWDFLLHRSFSWLVLILMTVAMWKVRKEGFKGLIFWIYLLLAMELISGITLSYLDVPQVSQVFHLTLACLLLGLLFLAVLKSLNSREIQ